MKRKDRTNKPKDLERKKHNFDVRQSLRVRLALIMIVTVVIIVLLCWGINKMFLQTVYEKTKVQSVERAYDFINNKFTKEVIDNYSKSDFADKDMDDIFTAIERTSSAVGINVIIYKKFTVGNEDYYEIFYPTNNSIRDREHFKNRIGMSGELGNNVTIIDKAEHYIIYKTYDDRLRYSNIELVGVLDSNVYVNLNTNVAMIEESAQISNRFLAWIGIFIAFIASIILYFISKNVTKPILELSEMAKKMADLDFDVKYNVTTNDEIAVLGNSINSLSRKLEKTVSELKNANIELQNDIQKKEQIDEMRREFLSNVSHELKTPIAIIQGYAEGLNENINDDASSRQFYCDVIVDEAKKMNNMVRKLLDLNNIEFGEFTMDITRFNIVELIKGILSSADILFQNKEVSIKVKAPKTAYVWADQYMIEEVLINYISNALNHVDNEKKIKIIVEKNKEAVRVKVFNSGKHIPQEDIDRIWDKFYKVDKARTREYGGSGVGLSIVKAIMTSHGRECGVNNVENGVEFWFELDNKSE